MYTSLLQLALVSSITSRLVVGNPLPQAYPINTCLGADVYENNKDKEEQFQGDPVTGSFSCDATGEGCTLTDESSYSVGVTTEVGGGLDFGEIASAGVSVSVAITKETGTSSGAQKSCAAGDYMCALVIKPAMVRVSGVKHVKILNSDGTCGSKPEDYTVTMPKKSEAGIKAASIDTCACKNFPGWADEAAPPKICPQDCP